MQIDRYVERFGAFKDRPIKLVVEIAAAIVAVDDRALEAELTNAAFQFRGGLVGRRGRQRGKPGETRWMPLHRVAEEIDPDNPRRRLMVVVVEATLVDDLGRVLVGLNFQRTFKGQQALLQFLGEP